MARNPIEEQFVLSFLVGLGVLLAMAIVGQAIGVVLLEFDVPYARWLGVTIGIVVVFLVFVWVYRRYDRAYVAD